MALRVVLQMNFLLNTLSSLVAVGVGALPRRGGGGGVAPRGGAEVVREAIAQITHRLAQYLLPNFLVALAVVHQLSLLLLQHLELLIR